MPLKPTVSEQRNKPEKAFPMFRLPTFSRLILSLATMAILAIGQAAVADQKSPERPLSNTETPPLVFVNEFVREIGAIHVVQQDMQKAQKANAANVGTLFADNIRYSTLMKLEITASVANLKGMSLKPPFETLVPTLIDYGNGKIALLDQLITSTTTILSGPQPGQDYGKLTADVSKISALLEFSDESVFKMTPLVFAVLIDMKPDSKGHVSRLTITKAERQQLIARIDLLFGSSLKQKIQNYTVSTASVLKTYLMKGYTCSDEPGR